MYLYDDEVRRKKVRGFEQTNAYEKMGERIGIGIGMRWDEEGTCKGYGMGIQLIQILTSSASQRYDTHHPCPCPWDDAGRRLLDGWHGTTGGFFIRSSIIKNALGGGTRLV